jgi:hypothetical protein
MEDDDDDDEKVDEEEGFTYGVIPCKSLSFSLSSLISATRYPVPTFPMVYHFVCSIGPNGLDPLGGMVFWSDTASRKWLSIPARRVPSIFTTTKAQ